LSPNQPWQVGANTPNFTRMEGNPICRQIDWDDNQELIRAWAGARTGFPWIDAIMTQLREQVTRSAAA
jgi:cryptochrome